MFNQTQAFEMQFTPHEKGYLYYPSRKSGGKFVTEQEYDQLAISWKRLTGRVGRWKIAGWTVAAIIPWIIFTHFLDVEGWVDQILFFGLVTSIVGRIFWVSFAPRRLVKGRPSVVPPRPIAEVRREVRTLLNWTTIIIVILISGVIFFGSIMSADRTITWWLSVTGSGFMLAAYIWVGFKKLSDKL